MRQAATAIEEKGVNIPKEDKPKIPEQKVHNMEVD